MVESLLVNIFYAQHFSISDYIVVTWDLISSTVVTGGNKKENYGFNQENYEDIMNYWTGIDWVSAFQELDIEGMWEVFLNKTAMLLNNTFLYARIMEIE